MTKLLGSALCSVLRRDDHGATAVEYSLIVVLIAAVLFAVVAVLGNQVSDAFSSVIGTW